jgi:hypothetical protein
MLICETTVRPMAAFWHPCHRGIRESIHIRRGSPASTDNGIKRQGQPYLFVFFSIFY